MAGPGRHIEGWSSEAPPQLSTLKIVSPALVQSKSGGLSNVPPIPNRLQVYNTPHFHPSRYQNMHHQPNHPHQGQVQIPRSIPQPHSNIQSPRPQKLPESFKESLLIVDDDPNPPKGITADGNWKSRQVKIQDPSLKSINRGRAPPIPYVAPHTTSLLPKNAHSNMGLRTLPPRPHNFQPGNSSYHSSSSFIHHPRTGPVQALSLRNIPNFNRPSETRHFISFSAANKSPSINLNLDRPLFSRTYLSAPATPRHTAGPAFQTGSINLDYLQYLQLSRLAIDNQIVFRVHSQSSVSPLIWSGDMKTSGFFATASVFQRLTPKSYEALFRSYQPDGRKDDEGWLTRPLMREVMIGHILCRPSKRFITVRLNSISDISQMAKESGREGEREDYWISTTRSVDWAIFEIARRLSMYLISGGREGNKEVRLAVLNKNSNLSSGNGDVKEDKVRERTVNPYLCLRWHESNILSPSKLEASIRARQRAKESYEILYWGRIFGENIQQDLVFSTDYLPFKLPSKFWKPPSAINPSLPGWLGRLRWNPIKDDWHSAVRCLRDKIYPTTKWDKQTVHDLGSTWPPTTTSPDATRHRSQKDAIGANSEPMLKVVSDTGADTDQFGSSRSGEVSLGRSQDKGSKEAVVDFMA
ncbi:hypothetical protein L486_00647 [Kwoniella mangroviensis CBS 10435]|uniref:Uncharacterized protein n=1 Tax=Kwoniella mangroviensis CBS 10435 TaxID=1331196 RepID=A0A1B9IZQ9_9TREE|nr:hypothetical protein L486_00647 [Kwoniella mangroviensis CBS 10435]